MKKTSRLASFAPAAAPDSRRLRRLRVSTFRLRRHWLAAPQKTVLGIGLALAVACGGSDTGEEESSGGEEAHEHHDHGEHGHDHGEHGHDHGEVHDHGELPPALHAFHGAFAAHWHGDRSAEAVCPDAENLKALSDAAGEEHGEHPDEVAELRTSSDAALAACASGEGWDAAFDRWHNALHGVMHDSSEHE